MLYKLYQFLMNTVFVKYYDQAILNAFTLGLIQGKIIAQHSFIQSISQSKSSAKDKIN